MCIIHVFRQAGKIATNSFNWHAVFADSQGKKNVSLPNSSNRSPEIEPQTMFPPMEFWKSPFPLPPHPEENQYASLRRPSGCQAGENKRYSQKSFTN